MQDGDVYHTYADGSKLEKFIGFSPEMPLHEGLKSL
jgi:nucleoside-diphosphate-sugar epimerase